MTPMDWLLPIIVVGVPVSVVLGLYLFNVDELPVGWRGSRLVFAVSHSAVVPACFAVFPGLGHWFVEGDPLGLAVFAVSVAIIAGSLWTRAHFDGNPDRRGFWDWLDISLDGKD